MTTRIIMMDMTTWGSINTSISIINKASIFHMAPACRVKFPQTHFPRFSLSQRANKLSSHEHSHPKCLQRFNPFASLRNILRMPIEIMRWVVFAMTMSKKQIAIHATIYDKNFMCWKFGGLLRILVTDKFPSATRLSPDKLNMRRRQHAELSAESRSTKKKVILEMKI